MIRAILPLAVGVLLGGAAVFMSQHLGPEVDTESLASGPFDRDPGLRANDARTIDADRGPGLESIVARATREPEAVLTGLPGLAPPATQRAAALAVLAALGNDDRSLERVAAMLPAADRLSFHIDALAARAGNDPGSALGSALALDSAAARDLAVARIAEVAAGTDPAAALAQASLIAGLELRTHYLAGVAAAWASIDPAAALTWLETAVPSALPVESAADSLLAIAARDHGFLLDKLDGMSVALRTVARRQAYLAWVERDPVAALTEIQSLGAGRDVTELEAAAAELYALSDPAAAVAWAKDRSESQTVLEGALRGAAAVDYDTAVDLAMDVLETEDIWPTFALVESGAGDFGQLADRLMASSVPRREQKLQALMVRWPQVDAEASLNWSLANADRLEQGWLRVLSAAGGRDYPELAVSLVDRVPTDLRDDWIAGVAGGMAANDADRALAFLEQHRGRPAYDQGLYAVVDVLAEADGAAAARVVDRTGAEGAGRVGWGWAQQDPVAASTWVASLEDPDERRIGIANVASGWLGTDQDAAIAWVLGLPDDQSRDLALGSALQSRVSSTGSLDEALLDEFGDDQIRARSTANAIVLLGRSNAEEARRLVDVHIEDPAGRRQALQRIAEQDGGIANIFTSSIDIPR